VPPTAATNSGDSPATAPLGETPEERDGTTVETEANTAEDLGVNTVCPNALLPGQVAGLLHLLPTNAWGTIKISLAGQKELGNVVRRALLPRFLNRAADCVRDAYQQ
jgi:hypothetical protein